MTRLIRHGTVARLRGRLMPGSATAFGPDALDTLDFEFEALTGRYRGSRFWEFMPVDTAPGRFADKDTRLRLRQMLDSALGLDPRDVSQQTRPKRVLPNLAAFDRIEFVGKIAIEHLGRCA